jgi:putative membrane protein
MRVAAYISLVLGLAVSIGLIAWRGFDTVLAAMGALGVGVLLLPLIYAPHILGAATSWSLLFPEGRRPPFRVTLHALWVGISVETLLPLGGLAAEVVKARLLIRSGVRAADAASLGVVDMTVQIVTLLFWGVIGACALVDTSTEDALFWPAVGGAGVLVIAVALMLYAQHAGLFGLFAQRTARKLKSERWRGITDGAAHLDRTIREIYERPDRILLAVLIRCCTRGLMAVEIWTAAWLMGHPIAPDNAAMFIGVVGTIRAFTFIVPGGWGLQEGAYVLLGNLVGVPADIALALSLASRARELILGVPALLSWQIAESRGLRGLLGRQTTSELDPA